MTICPPTDCGGGPSNASAFPLSTIAGTKLMASARSRNSRRHVYSCCGNIPCRRATSDTFAPGSRLSAIIRARASRVHRRLPPAVSITSSRSARAGTLVWIQVSKSVSSLIDHLARQHGETTNSRQLENVGDFYRLPHTPYPGPPIITGIFPLKTAQNLGSRSISIDWRNVFRFWSQLWNIFFLAMPPTDRSFPIDSGGNI